MKKITLNIIAFLCFIASGMAQTPPCTYSRPDIYSYTPAERLQLRNLIKTYLNTVIDISYPSGPQRYPLVYMHTMHTSMIHHTGTKAFTTWHRYYIQGLENWLMDNGYAKYVPLPYWDPTTTIPNEFFNSLAGGSAQLDAGFPDNDNQSITPPSRTNFITPGACGTHSSDNNFSNDLEYNYHDPIHGLIGGSGSMSSIVTAPGSAIFWLYHAWIDDMWFCYQRNCDGLGQDQYVREDLADDGTEPSSATVTWVSPDIWVRNNPDGFQNKSSEPLNQYPGATCYVYVRVWNRGQRPNDDGVGNVTAYWAKGGPYAGWPAPWNGTTTVSCSGTSRPLGGIIASQPLRRVNENFNDFTEMGNPLEKDYYIYEFAWNIPDPDWYVSCAPASDDPTHFCILAKLDDGHPMALTNDLYYDLHNFNNMAMKNITILGDGVMAPKHSGVYWGNTTPAVMHNVCVGVKFPNVTYATLLDHATIKLTLDALSKEQWVAAGAQGQNITYNAAGEIFVTADDARLCGFGDLAANSLHFMDIAVQPIHPDETIDGNYEFDFIQYRDFKTITNGQRYLVNHKDVIYEEGTDAGANPMGRQGNQVPGASKGTGYSIFPNPTQNTFQILANDGDYNIQAKLYDNLGRCVKELGSITSLSEFSTEDLPSGLYFIRITNNKTKATNTQKFIINK